MRWAAVAAGVLLLVVVVLRIATRRDHEEDREPTAGTAGSRAPSTTPASEADQGFLYGFVTTVDGAAFEGRLRWGGSEEAFWSDTFNGFKDENPWRDYLPPDQLEVRQPIEVFGVTIAHRSRQIDLGRPLMSRFGDIASIEALGSRIRVTLKSGTSFDLDRYDADDLADGLRVWDRRRGIVDLEERRIRTIELLPTPELENALRRVHGTVRTRHGEFTGFIQWNREQGVGTDALAGDSSDGRQDLRFDTIRSIERASRHSSLVTLLDGREIELSGTPEAGDGNRGVYVDDRRYGRVLVSWDAFERVDFSFAPSGPAYDDFPPGNLLVGTVTTHPGRRLTGRIVFDLDESETTETLDAPARGVDYIIPFGLVASIGVGASETGTAAPVRVMLHSGEELQLERAGDLGQGNAGLLLFVDRRERPEYVPWADVERIDFDRPPAMYPPLGGR